MRFKQDKIIDKISVRIREFDDELFNVAQERLKIDVDAKYLEIYLMTLNQELLILKDFDKLETECEDEMNEIILERNKLQVNIGVEKGKIDVAKRNLDHMKDSQKAIHAKFKATCMKNDFSDYLKRIFRKKMKVRIEYFLKFSCFLWDFSPRLEISNKMSKWYSQKACRLVFIKNLTFFIISLSKNDELFLVKTCLHVLWHGESENAKTSLYGWLI